MSSFKINKIKLFDELVITEIDLAGIISNYKFPKIYYKKELKRIRINIPKKDDEFQTAIFKNKDRINFRIKNIIFIGFDNKIYNKYYFLQLTTKHKNSQQSLYFEHIRGHKVYINLNKLFYFNFEKQKFWYSKFNNDKRAIIQKTYWKVDLINNMSKKLLSSLTKKTNIEIYKRRLDDIKYLKK